MPDAMEMLWKSLLHSIGCIPRYLVESINVEATDT